MQSRSELYSIIKDGRPDICAYTIDKWTSLLVQLKGCHLFSVESPETNMTGWLERRKHGIGGSEIAAILGDSEWSSPRQVWMNKLGMFDDKPNEQSEQARWGNLLETTVATEWANRRNKKWIHIPVILQDDERPYLLANIDGFVLSDDEQLIEEILEIKTTSAYNEDAWSTGLVPIYYMHQVNWYCGITRVPKFTVACLVGGQKLYDYSLPAQPEMFERQTKAADVFWLENVSKCIEPKANNVDVEMLSEISINKEKEPIIFTDQAVENTADAYCQCREKISQLEKIKKALQAQLLVAIGDAPGGVTPTHNITFTVRSRQSCNYDLLQMEFPAAYSQCVSLSSSKVMNVR